MPEKGEFLHRVPHGLWFFRQLYGVSDDPEDLAALAPQCSVFLIEEASG